MYRLSFVILGLAVAAGLYGQSPHGPEFRVNCADCHRTNGWDIPFDAWNRTGPVFSRITGWQIGWDTARFSHTKTNFPLTGRHVYVDCRACHESLVFSEAKSECLSCHTDMHNNTVGSDCARCHHTENWLVDYIPELHQANGFPLMGAHALAACADCHKSETNLRFERIGNDCINCHLADYNATTSPNHKTIGFSMQCSDCHDINRFDWTTNTINHDFFPLTKGHDIQDCARCHTSGTFTNTPSDCFACHQNDYSSAATPNHSALNFSQNCVECHTTDPGWMPAEFLQHDGLYFPIYSGKHKGEWDQCKDCHLNPANYAEFTCTGCHKNPETDNHHNGINGYSYSDHACLACHPAGNSTDGFDHNKTQFPLTGAHLTAACLDCHSAGYAGTPTDCAGCHTTDYNQSVNPNHSQLGIPADCATCHTTNAWQPATFPIHNNFYPLNGAHNPIANDCAACHKGDYNNTPNTCAGCHMPDYNQTTNPNHVTSGFSTDCAACHTESAWKPASFDHNQTSFPLKGAHLATNCLECHASGYAGTPTDCASCHLDDYNQTTNPSHVSLGFSMDCAACHTESAWKPASFDHNQTNFPLKGAHLATSCLECHAAGYAGTPTDCASCHMDDYNQTNSPNHASVGFPTACADCHTESAWKPANFNHDAQYFPIYSGKHREKWDQCSDCHPTPGNYAVFSCTNCHTNPTTNNDHSAVPGYSYSSPACLTCHPKGD